MTALGMSKGMGTNSTSRPRVREDQRDQSRGCTSLLEANGDVPLDGVAFSRLD